MLHTLTRFVALITRTFLDRPRPPLLVREARVEVSDFEDVIPVKNELMDLLAAYGLRAPIAASGIFGWERAAWVADFKVGRSDAREAFLLSVLPERRAHGKERPQKVMAENSVDGDKIMTLLLNRQGIYIVVTETVVKAEAENSRTGKGMPEAPSAGHSVPRLPERTSAPRHP
jgi:hypothetical protein